MGIKDLWSILDPYAERKPICELRGEKIAIDLAGWVCESLNVVDYMVHSKQHLKNLFFRSCYFIWEDITPIFVLDGVPPKLKKQVMEKRNEQQFRGVKPKTKDASSKRTCENNIGRQRFKHVLKQCELLLQTIGFRCLQAPGEAEAYCAYLNRKGFVDAIISQDSDCFAYGAIRVYRNFCVSSQGACSANGGSVDIYDMRQISSKIDIGQNKIIAMSLLCGCDYCPEGISGVGRTSVIKWLSNCTNATILERIRSWRYKNDEYDALSVRVNDKNICTNCGHIGRTQNHLKNGCGMCFTKQSCNDSLWKEQRLHIKVELDIRKKALSDPTFPNEEIIKEFLTAGNKEIPNLQCLWQKPNLVKFITQFSELLQWTEIYCFKKCLPILTRWHILNAASKDQSNDDIIPIKILKKCVVKGMPSVQILWQDDKTIVKDLIPQEQITACEMDKENALDELWTTIEPLNMIEIAYPSLIERYLITKEKQKPQKQIEKRKRKPKNTNQCTLDAFINVNGNKRKSPVKVTKATKTKTSSSQAVFNGGDLHKYFKYKSKKNSRRILRESQCSTPITKANFSDLDSGAEDTIMDLSNVVNDIVGHTENSFNLDAYKGKRLCYQPIPANISLLLSEYKHPSELLVTSDDMNIMSDKQFLSESIHHTSLDDSFDVLVKIGSKRFKNIPI